MVFMPVIVITKRAASSRRSKSSITPHIRSNCLCDNLRPGFLQTEQSLLILHREENLVVIHDTKVCLCNRQITSGSPLQYTSDKNDPIAVIVRPSFSKIFAAKLSMPVATSGRPMDIKPDRGGETSSNFLASPDSIHMLTIFGCMG